jgi:hypothetical protein
MITRNATDRFLPKARPRGRRACVDAGCAYCISRTRGPVMDRFETVARLELCQQARGGRREDVGGASISHRTDMPMPHTRQHD